METVAKPAATARETTNWVAASEAGRPDGIGSDLRSMQRSDPHRTRLDPRWRRTGEPELGSRAEHHLAHPESGPGGHPREELLVRHAGRLREPAHLLADRPRGHPPVDAARAAGG